MSLGRAGFVQPVEGVPGGIPIPIVISLTATPLTSNKAQNLGAGALSLKSANAQVWEANFVTISFNAVLVENQTLSIWLRSALGATYDVLVENVTLAPASSASAQSYVFSFPPGFLMNVGDEIEVDLTNAGGSETAIVSAMIRGVS